MSCLYPIPAWYSEKLTDLGKRSVVFNPREGIQDEKLELPCGKCVGCKEDKAREWTVRLYCENLMHERSAFLTLTYDDNNLPSDLKLNKKDIQLFIKRLRNNRNKLRYFVCGEYGGMTNRPHYHAIIFGMDFHHPYQEDIGNEMFLYPDMSKYWSLGRVVVAPVTPASIAYVAGYATKKIGDPDTFNIMSKRPPIAYEFVKKYARNINDLEGVIVGSSKLPVPSVFFDWSDELTELKEKQSNYVRCMDIEEVIKRKEKHRARERNLKGKLSARDAKQKRNLN